MKNTGQQNARDSSRSTAGLRTFIGLLCWCALLTASAYAQQVINFDDISSSGAPQTITNIQRSNGTVTANLGGNLIVPGNNLRGLINVAISTGDTSFAGTFVVQSGSGTSTLTWNQSGQNTGVLTPTGTVIAVGWGLCPGTVDPGSNGFRCAGGTADPTSALQTFGNTPSLDSGSMLLQESGPANANSGWFYKPGPLDTATGFTLDLQFNIPDNSKIQAAEFDQFQYIFKDQVGASANTKLVFGSQCVTGDVPANDDWQVWDEFNQNWVHTHVPCSYMVSSTAFNHLTISVHRVAGDTSCSGTLPTPRFGLTTFTGPAMYYTITLNGTLVVSNQKTCSGPLDTGFQEQTGLQIQLDTSAACGSACTITEYIDKGTFLATNIPWWPAIQQIILDD